VRIPLHRLLFPDNMPAGLDLAVVGLWVCYFRKTAKPCEPPIEVVPEGFYWRIRDGRHRVMAAMIAGRFDIDAKPESEGSGA
jgi:hypothetical protein